MRQFGDQRGAYRTRQFLGMLAALSMFMSWDYLFMESARIGGQVILSDTGAIEAAVDQVIAENPAAVADIRAGEKKAIGFLTGQIMQKTRGQANAGLSGAAAGAGRTGFAVEIAAQVAADQGAGKRGAQLGALQLLDETDLDPEQSRLVQLARKSARDLCSLAGNAVDLSRLESGQLNLEPAPFDIVATIEDACAFWRPLASSKGLTRSSR